MKKILFNTFDCGLGNNGGSQTIIRMTMALRKLGYDARIIINSPNKFTWFEYPKYIIIDVESFDEVPKCDCIIATGNGTVFFTEKYPIDDKHKFYWIRGFETWTNSEENILKTYNMNLRLIVNSTWQKQNIFQKCGKVSDLVFSGLPIEEFHEVLIEDRQISEKRNCIQGINIGGLYSSRSHKNTNLFFEICDELIRQNVVNEILMFGNEDFTTPVSKEFTDKLIYYKQPSFERKAKLLSKCHVWIATTVNDGFHIPPAEALLCGCNIVVNSLQSSGMGDYAIDGFTAKTFLNVEEAVKNVLEYAKSPAERGEHLSNAFHLLTTKIGNVETNARRLIKILEQ